MYERDIRQQVEETLRLSQLHVQAVSQELQALKQELAVAADNFLEAVYQYNLSRVELARAKGDVRAVLAEKAQ
jgi:hypothetical protein